MTATAMTIQAADEIVAVFAALTGQTVTLEHLRWTEQRIDDERGSIEYRDIFGARTGRIESVELVGLASVRVVVDGMAIYLYGNHPMMTARPFKVTIH